MSWLDFANYFLSNQKLHAWSWINRASLGNGFFWGVFRLLIILAFFLFCFGLVQGKKVASTQDFGWQLKGEDHFRSWFPFLSFVHLVTILYCSDIVWSKDLSAHFFWFLWPGAFFFFTFSHSLVRNFLSFLFSFSHSLIGNFLSLFFSFSLIGNFPSFLFLLPRVRIDILTLGQGLWWVRILAQGL